MKKIYLLPLLSLLISMTSCNDSFLDKAPTTSSSEATAFTNYNSIKSYMWTCYKLFNETYVATNPGGAGAYGMDNIYVGDWNAGYLSNKNNNYNDYAFQEITTTKASSGWDFSYIYHVNVMLKNLDASTLSADEKNHWKAVGYFFHSFSYMELINRFGDVPWVDKVMDPTDEAAYGPRIDRKVVADSVLHRLQWAEKNIGNYDDGTNTINKACVQMALSRFTLREGTWRKYHNLGDYENYLRECVRVSKEVMDAYPTLYKGTDGQPAAGYGEMWTSKDLKGIPGVILYKEFLSGYLTSAYNFREKNDQMHLQLTQDMVDMYLSKNGLPIANAANTQYEGASKDIYDVFRNRDPRLYHTVVPPYKIISGGGNKPADNPNCKWGYDNSVAKYREYIDLMGANSSCSNPGVEGQMKRLPIQNWNGVTIIARTPNIAIKGACSTSSGYYLWKSYNCWELCNNNNAVGEADKPIFKVEEAMLNYAEAACELGDFTQAVADISINKLRERAGVEKMIVADIDDNFDPNRDKGNNEWWTGDLSDYAVPALLWEVRRERIIELMGEGFGFYDVCRWAKAPYFINRQEKGAWVNKGTGTDKYSAPRGILNGNIASTTMTSGYLFVNPDPIFQGKGWLDQYYLYCVPLKEITINPSLTQNPGWPTVAAE